MTHYPTKPGPRLSGSRRVRSAICPRDVKQARASAWAAKRPQIGLTSRSTVGDALKAHLARLERDDSPSLQDIRSIIDCHIPDDFRAMPIVDLTPPDVFGWIEVMKEHLSSSSIHCRVSPLRAALSLAQQAGVIATNPCVAIPRWVLPVRKTEIDPAKEVLTAVEVARVLAAATGVDRVTFTLLAVLGLRVGEVSELRFSDVDRAEEPLWKVSIARSWSRKNHRVQKTKTGTTRHIPLLEVAQRAVVGPWMARGWAAEFGRNPGPNDLLVPRKLAGGLSQLNDRTLLRRWHKLLAGLGLAKRRLHALRHSFVSMLLAAGAEWRAVQRVTHPVPGWRGGLEAYAHYQWPLLCAAVSRLALDLTGSNQLELFPNLRG